MLPPRWVGYQRGQGGALRLCPSAGLGPAAGRSTGPWEQGREELFQSPNRKQMLVPRSPALISVPPGKLRHNKSLFLMMACQL